MKGLRWGLVALALLTAAAVPARAQTPPAEPEVSVSGAVGNGASAPSPSSPSDAALERVLRSGCRDGLDDVRALSGDPAAPWAGTVARLCGDILHGLPAQSATRMPESRVPSSASNNEGRGRLVLWSSLYGIWLGIATDVLFDVTGTRTAIIPPMVAMGASLGISLLATADHPLTTGQAWTIISGLDYATVNGALWGAGLGLSAKGVVGTAIATSAVATAVASWVAVTQHPRDGDVELVRSSLLWGTTAGLLAAAAFAPNISAEGAWRTGAIAMDLGLVAGIGLAHNFDLSRNRVLIVDAGAIGGGLVGLGIALLVRGNGVSGQAAAGGALGGLVAGIAIAAIATRHLDANDEQARAPAYPALFARDADGHWSLGLPGPTPVVDRTGTRPVGASLAALGGVF